MANASMPLASMRTASSTSLVLQLASEARVEPIVRDGICSELCAQLAQVILDRMQRDRGRKTGSLNVGGWKSTEDFFTWPDATVQELRHAIVAEIGVSPIAWAMVNRDGSHHPRHQHRIAILTGVYYVTVGNEEAPTPTIFECPSDARASRSARYEVEVDPHPGRLVISRGETWHRVLPCVGELPRITIAFDVRR